MLSRSRCNSGTPALRKLFIAPSLIRKQEMGSIVELFGVCKRYRQRIALDDVSFAIGRGEVVGLLGSNGAGKSTLLRIITGLVRPTCGEVRLFGKPLSPTVRSRIGALIERADAYPYLTGAENLEFVLPASRAIANAVADSGAARACRPCRCDGPSRADVFLRDATTARSCDGAGRRSGIGHPR
ncbi:MAG: hypothetical protein KatS3mg040_0685 [Candidatus Kapaibacterium sp.]|nr:MAG: hypothetical protein KatS3mg040_0685 [Candidatus Kapabacteria bacterium]